MNAVNWLAAAALDFILSASHLLGPDDVQAERDTAATVQALGQP